MHPIRFDFASIRARSTFIDDSKWVVQRRIDPHRHSIKG